MYISSVQFLSCVRLFATPWTSAHQASFSITNSLSLFKLMSIELMTPSNHLILSYSLLLLPLIFPSIRVFSNESILHIRRPKYWSFSILLIFGAAFLQDGLLGFPSCPRDSQESSPTPQFKSISSLALSILYGPSLTSVHDYWKNHSFDQTRCIQNTKNMAYIMLEETLECPLDCKENKPVNPKGNQS